MEQRAKVGGDGQVAALEALLGREARPPAMDAAASHPAAEHQHRGRVTVIGSAVAVLGDGPAELRHRQHHHVAQSIAEVAREGGETAAQLAQAIGELALLAALADMRVPAVDVDEADLKSDVGADELRHLAQRLAEAAAGIVGAVGGRQPRRAGALQQLHGLEGLAAGAVQQVVYTVVVERLEAPACPRGLAAGAHVEALERAQGEGAGVAAEAAGQPRPHRDRPKRRRPRGQQRAGGAAEPAVGRALHAGRSALHVVLGVEVRARRAGRAARVHEGQRPRRPRRLQRGQRRMEREKAVEVDSPSRLARAWAADRDAGARAVVRGVAVRHHHAESVDGAALEDGHQHLAAPVGRGGGAGQEPRRRRHGSQGAGTALQEGASGQ